MFFLPSAGAKDGNSNSKARKQISLGMFPFLIREYRNAELRLAYLWHLMQFF